MRISKAHRAAWSAHDAAAQALAELQTQPGPITESKALAIAQLCNAIDRLQDRIRIHRGKSTRRRPKSKRSRPAQAAGAPLAGANPPCEPVPSATPSGSAGESASVSGDEAQSDLHQAEGPEPGHAPKLAPAPPPPAPGVSLPSTVAAHTVAWVEGVRVPPPAPSPPPRPPPPPAWATPTKKARTLVFGPRGCPIYVDADP